VVEQLSLGSSLSMRSFARLGSCVSVSNATQAGCSSLALDVVMGSSISVRGPTEMSLTLSLCGSETVRVSLSVHEFVSFGGSFVSIKGITKGGGMSSVAAPAIFGVTRVQHDGLWF
jgi:hypothetical protein